jgi:hypothetical protein
LRASKSVTVFGFDATAVVGGEVVVEAPVVEVAAAVVVTPMVVDGAGAAVVVGAVTVDDELQPTTIRHAANTAGRTRRETMALRLGRDPQVREVAPVVFAWLPMVSG